MIVKVCNADFSLQWDGMYQFALETILRLRMGIGEASKVYCLRTGPSSSDHCGM